MTNKIGGIVIDVDARLTKLEKSIAKGNRDLRRFEAQTKRTGRNIESNVKGMSGSFALLKATLGGLAAGVSVQALGNLGKFALNFADDLATAADRANIGVESFQAYKEVFRELEVDSAGFDKALGRLNGTLGDVQRGVEDEATKALDAMGISAKITSGEITKTDQLLDAIAASAGTFGTEAEFTSGVIDIFGQRLGNQLAPALYQGTDALEEMKNEAFATGKVVDEELINRLADANEVVEDFSVRGRNAFLIFSADSIGGIQRLSDEIVGLKIIMQERGFIDAFFADLADARSEAQIARGAAADPFNTGSATGLFGTALGQLSRAQSRAARPQARAKTSSGGRSKSSGKQRVSEEQQILAAFSQQREENERILELQTLRFEGAELEADIQESNWRLQQRFPKLEEGRLEILKRQSAEILIQAQRYQEVSGIVSDLQSVEILGAGQDEVTEGLNRLLKENGFAADGIEAANVRIAKSFQDTANDTLAAIDRMTSSIKSGGFLGILQSVIGLGLQLGSIGLFGSNVASNINSIPKFATGTGHAPAGLAIVGEQGPELVRFSGGEQVVPNNQLRAAGPSIPSGMMGIRIYPSDLFYAVMEQQAAKVAAPMAAQGAIAGSQLASEQATRQKHNAIP